MAVSPGIDVTADLHLAIGELTTAVRELRADLRKNAALSTVIRQVPLTAPQMTLAGGAGVIDYPDTLKAKTGYYWSIRRLTLTGFTAGSASVKLNDQNGELLVPYPVAAANTFGRGEILLHPDDRLVITATGITGFVQLNGAADCFESWYLPEYLA